ncbi:MAG: hypothetical protein ABJB66_10875 [Gemmatimonadaceae bacterium]
MSKIIDEPAVEPARGYFSQLCVLFTGIASGVVEPEANEGSHSLNYHMGKRDGYHVVVAHLASSRTLLEASEKCAAFGRGVEERGEAHPYGPDWCSGFASGTLEASSDIAMYAASGVLPIVDKGRLKSARTAARNITPLPGAWPAPKSSHREW